MNIDLKINTLLTAVIAVSGIFLATSCKTQKNASAGIAGDWNIVAVNGTAIDTLASERTPFIHFEGTDGRIYGNTGCNNLMGNCVFDRKNGTVTFSRLGSTMMSCPDMKTEMAILKALEKTVSYRTDKAGDISLLDADGNSVLTLKAAPKK